MLLLGQNDVVALDAADANFGLVELPLAPFRPFR